MLLIDINLQVFFSCPMTILSPFPPFFCKCSSRANSVGSRAVVINKANRTHAVSAHLHLPSVCGLHHTVVPGPPRLRAQLQGLPSLLAPVAKEKWSALGGRGEKPLTLL